MPVDVLSGSFINIGLETLQTYKRMYRFPYNVYTKLIPRTPPR